MYQVMRKMFIIILFIYIRFFLANYIFIIQKFRKKNFKTIFILIWINNKKFTIF